MNIRCRLNGEAFLLVSKQVADFCKKNSILGSLVGLDVCGKDWRRVEIRFKQNAFLSVESIAKLGKMFGDNNPHITMCSDEFIGLIIYRKETEDKENENE